MRKAVLGLIGVGNLANAQHLPNLMWTRQARLKTVCDVRPEAVKAAQEKYNIPCGEADYRKVLGDPEIDGVIVVTKAEQHAELTVAALNAGKHVYVEKPLAESAEQCAQIVQVEKKSGKHVAVGFNRRFAPAYRKAKELLDANGGARTIYYRISDTYSYTRAGILPPGTRVFHETCHIFDILRWLTGSEIVSVYCVEERVDDEIVTCKFRNNAIASILSSGYSTLDWPKEYLEVIAKKGGLTVDSFVEMWTYGLKGTQKRYRFRGHLHPDREWTHRYLYEALGSEALRAVYALRPVNFPPEEKDFDEFGEGPEAEIAREFIEEHIALSNYDVDKGWRQSVDHFAECIVTGRKPENANARDGLIAEQLARAVVKSRKTGKPVVL
jgi:predicted dehydrogenase